jgi:hypothetical protein
MTDLIGITIHAWQRVPGAWPIGSGSGVTLAILAIRLTIAKIANQCGLIGNIGYLICIAKNANKRRENRQREVWRGVVASVIGAKTLAILARLSCENNRC